MRQTSAVLLLALGLGLVGCRKSDSTATTGISFVPSMAGSNGCSGPDQVFTPVQTPQAVALATLAIGPSSQVTSAGGAETLYATGTNATLVSIDVSVPAAPVEAEILTAAGMAIANELAPFGIVAPELSGVAVLDATSLLVVERTSNTIFLVGSQVQDFAVLWAGQPNTSPGFADGPALGPGAARFAFTAPAQIAPLSGGLVLVADPGNHAVRLIQGGSVFTLAGTGSPFFADDSLDQAGFDTPTGLTVTCSGVVFITELGGNGFGHRLRELIPGAASPFGGLSGDVMTRAGQGLDGTMGGDGTAAFLGGPVSPLTTSDQDTYWLDSTDGILRRMTGTADTVDCPLWTDCTQAVAMGGNFSPAAMGGALSLTQTPSGILYVLDAAAGALFQVTP